VILHIEVFIHIQVKMSEGVAASFFAKKKKKKAFTLNANWVDADTVTSTTHVDAPALSTDVAPVVVESLSEPISTIEPTVEADGEWDDAAVVTLSGTSLLGAKGASSAVATLELGTLSSAGTSSQVEDRIAEKLAVEETRAALAAARLGMERQAAAAQAEPTAAPAKPAESSGGKYIPAHLRKSAAHSSTSAAFNVASNELFPDLQQAEQMAATKSKPKITKPKAVWGPKSTVTTTASKAMEAPTAVVSEPAPTEQPVPQEPEAAAESITTEAGSSAETTPAATSSSISAPTIPKTSTTKKKKKDLSTFKVASSTS
jgi:hypothetical protein